MAVFVKKGERVVFNGSLVCIAKEDITPKILEGSSREKIIKCMQWFITPPNTHELQDAPGFRDMCHHIECMIEGTWRKLYDDDNDFYAGGYFG